MIKIFYDTETTGTKPNRHSIVQLSGLIEKDGNIVDSFDYNIAPHPKAEIEPAALAANGKTIEELSTYPKMSLVHFKLIKLIGKYINQYDAKDKAWLIGFNNRAFDDFFMRKFFELCGDPYFNSWFWSGGIDVSCLAAEYLAKRRIDMPSFKLKRVALELGIHVEKDKLHDAFYDVQLTRQIYRIVTGIEEEDLF